MESRYDAIVVGVGGVGSAAAYHLAGRGADVLGIERFDVPHRRGSSHGTRIVVPSGRDPELTPLHRRAYDRWETLDAASDRNLLYTPGSLAIGPEESYPFADELRACREHGVEHEVLTGTEVSERFPAYDVPDRYRAVFQPGGGFLDARRCTVAHVAAALDRGATIRARERVLDWEPTGGGVRVRTDRSEYRAERLVVAGGAWTGELVDRLEDVLTTARHATARFRPESPEQFAPGRFPAFAMGAEEGFCYGTPVHRAPGFKLGSGEPAKRPVTPGEGAGEATREDEARLRRLAERYVPDGAGPTMGRTAGFITRTPDDEPVIDALESGRVVVGAGFSGWGFKLAPVFGEMLAALALEGDADGDAERFRLSRFE